MEKESREAWARFDAACQAASDQYIKDVQPLLEAHERAMAEAMLQLQDALTQIYQKEPKS